MVTLQDAYDELGYDEVDDVITRKVTRDLNAAKAMMRGAVGEDVEEYLPGDPRIDELVLYFLGEVHDCHGGGQKQAAARSRHAVDIELQLKMELRRKKEETAGGDNA